MRRLSKYYRFNDNALTALGQRGVWCQEALKQNDPFEGLSMKNLKMTTASINKLKNSYLKHNPYNFSKEKLDEFMKTESDLAWVDLINSRRKKFLTDFAFASFIDESENKDENVAMWAHYGGDHAGFRLVFDFEENPSSRKDILIQVKYQQDLPQINIDKFGDIVFGPDKWDDISIRKLLSVKIDQWSHEHEWRIWKRSPGPGYYHYEDRLKEVYFGARSTDEQRHLIAKSINDEKVKFFEMKAISEPPFLVKKLKVWYMGRLRD